MESTFDALIVGGGFAGLSCAAALAGAGAKVLVLEKKPHLGGRAFSFRDPETGDVLDNGQHLFLHGYQETRKFLRRVGAEQDLWILPKVRLAFADDSGRRDILSCPNFLPAPWHLTAGVLRLGGLSWRDKLGIGRLDRYMRKHRHGPEPEELNRLTVTQWLSGLGQSRRVQERLFNPVALGALNDDPAVAGAAGFFQVMREAFYRDARDARPALAAVGLSDLYAERAAEFIRSRGGNIMTRTRAAAVIEDGGRVRGVKAENGENFYARAVVSTLPSWDLARWALPGELASDGWRHFKPAPIIGINVWLDRPILNQELFVGLIGTDIQWAFDKSAIFNRKTKGPPKSGQYLSLVISGAHQQLGLTPQELVAMAERDLAKCFLDFRKARILRHRVIKEPFATLSPVPGTEPMRPKPGLAVPGFYLAGDWTSTGLPATIESAVVSGHRVAAQILEGGIQ